MATGLHYSQRGCRSFSNAVERAIRAGRSGCPQQSTGSEIIVDPKVVAAFNEAHVAQMIGYLTISSLELALLLNFKSARLEWKRIIRQHNKGSDLDLHA